MIRFLFLVCLGLVGCDKGSPPVAALPALPPAGERTPGWYALASMPRPVQESSVLSVGDEVWVLGGFDDQRQILDTVYIYGEDGWRRGPDLPWPRHHINGAVVDDKVYILGSLAGQGFVAMDDAAVYEDGQWRTLAAIPQPLGASAVGAVGDTIFVSGGVGPNSLVTSFAFDTGTETYRDLASLPDGRDHGVGVGGDAFMVFGGRKDGLSNVHGDSFRLNEGWDQLAAMPTPRAGAAGGLVPSGDVIIVGGEGNPDDPYGVFASNERYVSAKDRWERLEPMPTPRHGMGAAWFQGGLLVPGGAAVQGLDAVDVVEFYVPESP